MHRFQGIHILGEMYGISPSLLEDPLSLEEHLRKGIEASEATLCGLQVKEFDTGGLTILALLAESHASVHTYPEFGSLFFDAFTCGDRCHPERIAQALIEALKPEKYVLHKILRGEHSSNCNSELVEGKEFHIPSSSGASFRTEPTV